MLVSMNFRLAKMFYLKDFLQKAATMKRLEYSPIGKDLKNQTSVTEKKYQN